MCPTSTLIPKVLLHSRKHVYSTLSHSTVTNKNEFTILNIGLLFRFRSSVSGFGLLTDKTRKCQRKLLVTDKTTTWHICNMKPRT